MIAELYIEHPDLPLTAAAKTTAECRFQREEYPVSLEDDGRFVLFVVVHGPAEGVTGALAADPTVRNPHLVTALDGQRVYSVELTARAKLLAPTLAELGIRLLDAESDGDGWALRVLVPSRERLVELNDHCTGEGIDCEVRALYAEEAVGTGAQFGLTDTQETALLLAYERGYFDDPRRVSLQELASESDVSSTAFGRRLRRSIASLVESSLDATQ